MSNPIKRTHDDFILIEEVDASILGGNDEELGYPCDAELIETVRQLKGTSFFNHQWYVSQYPDVRALQMDAHAHYALIGAKLGRRPGPDFDAEEYLQRVPAAAESGMPPLIHYLKQENYLEQRYKGYLDTLDMTGISGWAVDSEKPDCPVTLQVVINGRCAAEFRTSKPRLDVVAKGVPGACAGFEYTWPSSLIKEDIEVEVRFKEAGRSLKKSPRKLAVAKATSKDVCYYDLHRAGVVRGVTVIVTVFNAYEAVADCLESLAEHRTDYSSVMVINDASSDPRISELLGKYEGKDGFSIVENEANIGYTRSVNKAVAMSGGDDVVLLNSDTRVTARWLDNLRFCAYTDPTYGTVTALSNNAGAFSVPVAGVCNEMPAGLGDAQLARVVTHSGYGVPLEVPTANGFCMYVKRMLIEEIGLFDEQKYPRGYGEENDLSMRAMDSGWKNVVCDKAFVFHKRSQSFKGEKEELIRAGSQRLRADYPQYKQMIRRFNDLEFTLMRNRVEAGIEQASPGLANPRILFVVSTLTGGTPQTNMDLMRSLAGRYGCFLLRCDSREITLSELVDDELIVRESVTLDRTIEPESHVSSEYNRVVCGIMHRYSISLLHIRHIAWHGLDLAAVAKSMNIPVVYSFHDFYSVCASHNLLDEAAQFCGGRCTSGSGACPSNLWPAGRPVDLKHSFIRRWRSMFGNFLDSCDRFVTTSRSAAEIVEDNYPALQGRISVIAHGRDFDEFHQHAELLPDNPVMRLLVPGNIGPSKGSELIRELASQGCKNDFELHLLGTVATSLRGVGIQHGRYERSDFGLHVEAIRPSLGLILSIWPETYCHTLTEMWACGVPVLAMDIGAVGERIRASGGGWLMPVDSSPEDIVRRLDEIRADRAGYLQRVAEVMNWQANEGVENSISSMSSSYQKLYGELLCGQQAH